MGGSQMAVVATAFSPGGVTVAARPKASSAALIGGLTSPMHHQAADAHEEARRYASAAPRFTPARTTFPVAVGLAAAAAATPALKLPVVTVVNRLLVLSQFTWSPSFHACAESLA